MRPTISWSDLRGRTVGIYGLRREGEASLRKCLALGIDPVLVDDAAQHPVVEGRPVLVTEAGGLDALTCCDVVIKTPGVSRYGEIVQMLERRGILVVGGLGLWLQEADRSKVMCITGTKGKSTTTAIAGHLLNRLGYRCLVGGNIGIPPYDPVCRDDYDFWVVEVSSYQATDLACTPPVFAVTSLDPDHLPWHRYEPETYFCDKLSGCAQPGADVTIVNGDSALIRAREHLLGPRVRRVHAADEPGADWMMPLGLLGAHNRRNALIARAGLQELAIPEAADPEALHKAAMDFPALESRLCLIGTVGEVAFVDDSLSTNVLPTLAAVEAFPDRRIALIVGGQSRGIDYAPLAAGLRRRTVETLLITVPDNGPEIRREVETVGAGPLVTVAESASLIEGVVEGYHWAKPDGIVLLSPAAASFGRFRDYRERSAVFAAAMESCRSG
ncbi:MAG: UDP-N-acetylmuramoyl-L-alanine--D-glutamate ligase [Pseudonocardiaceae bacterium]